MNLSVRNIIVEVNPWLNFFNLWLLRAQQQQEVNFSSFDGMSLQTFTADYWPGAHTAALLVVRIKVDIF